MTDGPSGRRHNKSMSKELWIIPDSLFYIIQFIFIHQKIIIANYNYNF